MATPAKLLWEASAASLKLAENKLATVWPAAVDPASSSIEAKDAVPVAVGALFTGANEIVTVASLDKDSPSEAVTVNVLEPFSFAAGT